MISLEFLKLLETIHKILGMTRVQRLRLLLFIKTHILKIRLEHSQARAHTHTNMYIRTNKTLRPFSIIFQSRYLGNVGHKYKCVYCVRILLKIVSSTILHLLFAIFGDVCVLLFTMVKKNGRTNWKQHRAEREWENKNESKSSKCECLNPLLLLCNSCVVFAFQLPHFPYNFRARITRSIFFHSCSVLFSFCHIFFMLLINTIFACMLMYATLLDLTLYRVRQKEMERERVERINESVAK